MATRFIWKTFATVFLALGLLCTSAVWAAETVTYTYDSLGRLSSALYAGAGRIVYSYDAMGNLVSVTRIATGTASADDPSGETVAIELDSLPPAELAGLAPNLGNTGEAYGPLASAQH